MQIKRYVLFSAFFLVANVSYAVCDSGYLCMTSSVNVCMTAPGTSCSSPESPVIVYYNDDWDSAFGGTINFSTIPATGVVANKTWDVTLGTLDSSTDLTITSASAANQTQDDYDIICNDGGVCGTNAAKIPYTVQYKACDGNSQYISPDGNAFSSASYANSIVSFAGVNPACKPQDNGGAAGQLIFSIIPASSGAYGAGDYTGTFCMTVCTTPSGCSVPACS